jgi:hypothetical protein
MFTLDIRYSIDECKWPAHRIDECRIEQDKRTARAYCRANPAQGRRSGAMLKVSMRQYVACEKCHV